VLDITAFSTIIYIWYEGGELRPSLVRIEKLDLALPHLGHAWIGAEDATKRRATVVG